MFYRNNRHLLKLHGSLFHGVVVHSGVRQGCPLSGLLFALCIDVLLEKIDARLHGDEVIGAFADDIAVVVEDFWEIRHVARGFVQGVLPYFSTSAEYRKDRTGPSLAMWRQGEHQQANQGVLSAMVGY